jgi:Kdo2-lipid IVA lauroyltransferase/acyltransferase
MYYLVYGLLYLFSLLPMPVLYLFSDAFYVLIYYIIGYRKKVVLNNLKTAFPEKTNEEIIKIARQFYLNFIDTFIETIKLISASESFIKKRFTGDASLFDQLYKSGLRCQVHLGHNFNWELANIAMPLYTSHLFVVVYMPIKNAIFEKLFFSLRSRTGSKLIPATNMKKGIMAVRDTTYILALVADQVPGDVSRAYWLNFFGKPTPFVQGPEKGARAGNIPVVFARITKTRRGYYQFHLTLAADNPAVLPEGELTKRYITYLEEVIRQQPEMWLWSHRRWKREWSPEYTNLWIDSEPVPVS